ncbi:MAG: hypothetical protein LBQ42_09025 [Synergistaceae bacterium]|jgi:hypothetical protein|nr:hypothetical protein [Synergistaceae bacterium]
MPQPWATWTDQQWLDNAASYHAARLTADAWSALDATKQSRALTSARTQLTPWIENANYPMAVYEQALWMTTEAGSNSINDYSSVSVGESSVSVSYGRSRSSSGNPAWMSPVAWALLGEDETMGSRGKWTVGRLR